jgi:hypothetical protein
MSDNVISLAPRRWGKGDVGAHNETKMPPAKAAEAAAAAQVVAEQEERAWIHAVLVDAITRVLDGRPLATDSRLEIARCVVRGIMGPTWRVVP